VVTARARLASIVAAGVVLAGVVAAPGATPVAAGSPSSAPGCATPDKPFTPKSITIRGVVGATRVLALGRDRNGVPRTPPLTDRGKWEFGWDKTSHIRPGNAHGVVRLDAHTYPRDGSYGLALGNRLLSKLRKGAVLVAKGHDGQKLCYRVTRQLQVKATQSVPAYYDNRGKPQLAILVCSGVRRGPGDWSHRTIWFAKPVGG
jgi:hypothetical protein